MKRLNARVEQVWLQGFTGLGVTTAVVDDGEYQWLTPTHWLNDSSLSFYFILSFSSHSPFLLFFIPLFFYSPIPSPLFLLFLIHPIMWQSTVYFPSLYWWLTSLISSFSLSLSCYLSSISLSSSSSFPFQLTTGLEWEHIDLTDNYVCT